MEKTLLDYISEVVELIPVLLGTGMAVEQAVSWVLGKLKAQKGGGVPSAQDWEELRTFRAAKKAELKANVARLLAEG